MDDYKQLILGSKPGEIIPIVKEIDMEETVDFLPRRHKESRRIWPRKGTKCTEDNKKKNLVNFF